MLELAAAIMESVAARPNPSRTSTIDLRLRFARLVNRHCLEEGALIRAAVSGGAICPALASEMDRELTTWRAALASMNSDWPSDRVARDPHGFTSRFRVLVDALRRYIVREEEQVLARIGRS